MTGHEHAKLRTTNHDYEWHPKYYGVVVGVFCALYMITTAIASKLVDIHGFITSAGIILFPACAIISDLLTEVYGFNRTRQAIWTVLFCTILFALFTKLAVLMPPAAFWEDQAAFEKVFASTWRIALGGLAAWPVGEFLNSYVMSKMKIFQNAKHMSLRFIGSTVLGQLGDTLTYAVIAFAWSIPWDKLAVMILLNWGVKVLYEIFALPVSMPITNWLKHREGIEHFDKQKISIV